MTTKLLGRMKRCAQRPLSAAAALRPILFLQSRAPAGFLEWFAKHLRLCNCADWHRKVLFPVCLQARVEAAGGQILFWNGVRVMGVLAVSRAIGDHCLRPFVIAQPEVGLPMCMISPVWDMQRACSRGACPASTAGPLVASVSYKARLI